MAWPRASEVALTDGEGDAGGGHCSCNSNDVLPGYQLGYAVLNLEAGVHFQEEKMPVGGDQKLHGAGVGVANLAAQLPGQAAKSVLRDFAR